MTTELLLVIGILLLGQVLLALEIFVIPGFGVVGVLGIAMEIGGVAVAWFELGPWWGVGSLVASIATSIVLFWAFQRTGAGKRLVLNEQTRGTAQIDALERWNGRQGKAITPLRPSGAIEIDGDRIDAVTDGRYVEPGSIVVVVGTRSGSVLVDTLEPFVEVNAVEVNAVEMSAPEVNAGGESK